MYVVLLLRVFTNIYEIRGRECAHKKFLEVSGTCSRRDREGHRFRYGHRVREETFHTVRVPHLLGSLSVWRQKPKKKPLIDKYEVCTAVFGMHVVCASVRVWSLPGGLLLSQEEAEYVFSRFIPTNKPKFKHI